jgi:hypothetical protein
MISIDVISGTIILDHRTAHRSLTKCFAVSGHSGGMEVLDTTSKLVKRCTKKGIGSAANLPSGRSPSWRNRNQ